MTRLGDLVRLERRQGNPVAIGDTTVTPQSQALIVRSPWGGLVLNRPTGVRVERGGHTESVRIVDVTRLAQMALLGLGLGMLIYRGRGVSRRRRSHNG